LKQPATGDNGFIADVSKLKDSVSGEIENPSGKDVDMKDLTDTRSVDGFTNRLFYSAVLKNSPKSPFEKLTGYRNTLESCHFTTYG